MSQAVAGVWNEHGLRQYAMFLNLRIHESSQQLATHISGTGGATSGYRYCMDGAIGNNFHGVLGGLAVFNCALDSGTVDVFARN